MLDWQIGARFGLNPVLPEGYVRILTYQEIGFWIPNIGIEVGITNRIHFDKGKKLLQETREAMVSGISPFYIACQTTPLSFKVFNRWRISVLEFHIGTHLGKIGQTMRLQVGILTIGKTF